MALLKISNELYFGDRDLIDTTFRWLRLEYNATIKGGEIHDRYMAFFINGKGLPNDKERIDINCTRIVDKVYAFEILPF